MRILAEIPHDIYKVTVFEYQGRYTVQIETPVYIQSYKLPVEQFPDGMPQLKLLIEQHLLAKADRAFEEMKRTLEVGISNGELPDEEFEVII